MEWVNDGEQIGIIYLDFRIAIEKRLLPTKMTLGIDNELLCWLQDQLKDRKPGVCLAGENSDWTNVTGRVPQGRVSDPLLSLMYVNDIDAGITESAVRI